MVARRLPNESLRVMRNVICTLAFGREAEEMAKISVPLMRNYASRIGARFVILGRTDISDRFGAMYEKSQILTQLDHHDRALFIDIDVVISPRSPNIFDWAPEGAFSATLVGDVFRDPVSQVDAIRSVFGYELDMRRYFNAGVFLLDQATRRIIELDDEARYWVERGSGRLHDQPLMNYRAQRYAIPFFDLGPEFNFTRARGFGRRFRAHFIHYAGLSQNRIALMNRDAESLMSLRSRLYGAFPPLTRLRDRIVAD